MCDDADRMSALEAHKKQSILSKASARKQSMVNLRKLPWVFVVYLVGVSDLVAGEDASSESGSPNTLLQTDGDAADSQKTSGTNAASQDTADADTDTFNAKDHTDWGSYYDPKNIFCGKYDCYQILGFDYENYGKEKPSTKTITKRYRALSREWHPDKSKHKDAKERFVVRMHWHQLKCRLFLYFWPPATHPTLRTENRESL